MAMYPMQDVYWFLDSVPTKDLDLTKQGLMNGEDYYVIGGIVGELRHIIEIYDCLNLRKDSKGRKFVKNSENLVKANKVLNQFIESKRCSVFGTVFYHSLIPEIFKNDPDSYVSWDYPKERGVDGMKGRAFAQTIWEFMEYYALKMPNINPIVCLDNEDQAIKDSVKHHFWNQMAKQRPNAKLKVQSEDRAIHNEPTGYRVADHVCSILGNYITFPEKYAIFDDLIRKISNLIQVWN